MMTKKEVRKKLQQFTSMVLLMVAVPAHAADVEIALINTFGHEGGYQNMRADSGNWTGGKVGKGEQRGTKYGIAASSYPKEDIRNLTIQRASIIYRRDFWGALRLDDVKSQIIANEIFDAAVNMGTGYQAKALQHAINRAGWPMPPIAVDGAIGPATIARLNFVDQVALYCHLVGLRYDRYARIVAGDPIKEQFFRTWVYRIKDNVRAAVLAMESKRRRT